MSFNKAHRRGSSDWGSEPPLGEWLPSLLVQGVSLHEGQVAGSSAEDNTAAEKMSCCGGRLEGQLVVAQSEAPVSDAGRTEIVGNACLRTLPPQVLFTVVESTAWSCSGILRSRCRQGQWVLWDGHQASSFSACAASSASRFRQSASICAWTIAGSSATGMSSQASGSRASNCALLGPVFIVKTSDQIGCGGLWGLPQREHAPTCVGAGKLLCVRSTRESFPPGHVYRKQGLVGRILN